MALENSILVGKSEQVMNFFRYCVSIGVTALIAVSLTASHAYAYIDPGTGSYILQIVLAAALGALFALKMFWRNVKAFLTNLLPGRQKQKHD